MTKTMPNTYTDSKYKGIIFFEKPYEVNQLEWCNNHLECDSISISDYKLLPWTKIHCYASESKYNGILSELYQSIKDKGKYSLIMGLPDLQGVGFLG